jgi:signal transduction histidine kinase
MEWCTSASSCSRYVLNLLNSSLELSQLEAGSLVLLKKHVNLRELCLEVASELQTLVLPGEFVVYRLSHA